MNFTTLLEMINASEAREDDPEFQSPVDLMFERLEERDPDHFAVRQYKKFLLSAGKTRSSILISAGARMAPFDIREVRELMEDDEDFQNPVDLMFERLEEKDPEHFAVKQYKKYKLAAGVVCSKRLLNQAVGKSLRTHNLKPKKGAQAMRKNEKITALYERLSRADFGKDDDQQRESNSISNQKAMLEEFAARQGFTNIVHFTDDGISGTCFDRPGFLAMMKEVEAGNVEYLCIRT